MVGRLQTNKVRHLPDGLASVQSIDRSSLVARLARHYEGAPVPALFVEVNVAGEGTKGGVGPAGLTALLDDLAARHLVPAGLMTMAPWSDDPERARPVFAALRDLAAATGLAGLSMGMTDDYEVAVEEGATMVRVGRAIFGERP
jgi:uncharacterized pyridoxal phosphate-containing UPF0001 family protein